MASLAIPVQAFVFIWGKIYIYAWISFSLLVVDSLFVTALYLVVYMQCIQDLIVMYLKTANILLICYFLNTNLVNYTAFVL